MIRSVTLSAGMSLSEGRLFDALSGGGDPKKD